MTTQCAGMAQSVSSWLFVQQIKGSIPINGIGPANVGKAKAALSASAFILIGKQYNPVSDIFFVFF